MYSRVFYVSGLLFERLKCQRTLWETDELEGMAELRRGTPDIIKSHERPSTFRGHCCSIISADSSNGLETPKISF